MITSADFFLCLSIVYTIGLDLVFTFETFDFKPGSNVDNVNDNEAMSELTNHSIRPPLQARQLHK